MKLLFENEFIAIYWDSTLEIVRAVWTEETATMQDDDFKVCIQAIWAAIKEYKPTGFVGDTRDFMFSIDPTMQEWYGANIVGVFGNGTNKIGMIMSEYFVEQLSIEQTIEEDATTGVITQYFDNEYNAIKWASS
jgi:hypothetical protein